MAISIECPSCHKKLKGSDGAVGKQATCPSCGKIFVVSIAPPATQTRPLYAELRRMVAERDATAGEAKPKRFHQPSLGFILIDSKSNAPV
jgi:hypothetical protein